MRRIANVICLTIIISLATGFTPVSAGVLSNLEKELTELVKNTDPYLVTIEAKDTDFSRLLVGSGILIDKEGYILTTSSVVRNNEQIEVKFKDEQIYDAELIGIDDYSGLTLLKIDPVDRKLPEFGDPYRLKKGSWITVVANSFDIPGSLNFGSFTGFSDNGFLQLTVKAGPGSAGGAIFNSDGEVVGILVARSVESVNLYAPADNRLKVAYGLYDNATFGMDMASDDMSLAVPIDRIEKVVDQLKNYGEIHQGFLGIRQKRVSKNNSDDKGVFIAYVTKDSPADKAGLQENDIIIEFDGKGVKGPSHLYNLVRSRMPGDVVEVVVLRDSERINMEVELGEIKDDNLKSMLSSNRFDKLAPGWDSLKTTFQDSYQKFFDSYSDDQMLKFKKQYSIDLEKKVKELEAQLQELNKKFSDIENNLND